MTNVHLDSHSAVVVPGSVFTGYFPFQERHQSPESQVAPPHYTLLWLMCPQESDHDNKTPRHQ